MFSYTYIVHCSVRLYCIIIIISIITCYDLHIYLIIVMKLSSTSCSHESKLPESHFLYCLCRIFLFTFGSQCDIQSKLPVKNYPILSESYICCNFDVHNNPSLSSMHPSTPPPPSAHTYTPINIHISNLPAQHYGVYTFKCLFDLYLFFFF